VKPLGQEAQVIKPGLVRDEVSNWTTARTRHDTFVCFLETVEEDGFFTIGEMDVAKDVETGLHAPDFTKEIIVAKA
jgi:hypothetical protein